MADRPESTRRSVLRTAGLAVGAVGLAGCSSLLDSPTATPHGTVSSEPSSDSSPTSTDAGKSSRATSGEASVASLGVARTDADYAVLGQQDAIETATLYGGWKCPYTQEIVNQMLPAVVERYVTPGDLAIEFRAVRFQADESWGDDEARSNRAGQAVWHEAPEQFPEYVATLYANQPSEQTEWATVDTLVSFAEEAGVEDTDAVRESITTGEYSELWQATQDLVREKGIRGIPRLELGGEITAPTIDPESTERQLTQTLE